MMTYEQALDAMQLVAGPMAALVFVPLRSHDEPPFDVVPHERRSDAERDYDHAGHKRCGWPVEVTP